MVQRLRFFARAMPAAAICLFFLEGLGVLRPAIVRAQDSQQFINVNGALRSFVMHLPIGYDSSARYPLVIVLHGAEQTAQDVARLSRFDFVADRYGFIAFYPNSDDVHWDLGGPIAQPKRRGSRKGGFGDMGPLAPLTIPGSAVTFPDSPGSQNASGENEKQAGDVAFFNQMVDKFTATYSIDSSRIFATGYSDGGLMDFQLACSMSKRIAAIAPVAAAMPKGMPARCELARAVPLLMINGTSDPVVHYGGGKVEEAALTTLAVQTTAESWAQLDRCGAKPTHAVLPPRDKKGMRTLLDTYTGCRNGAEVALYTIDGGGNTWPSGLQSMPEKEAGKTSTDLDASETIWKFFSTHPMAASPKPN